MIFTEDKLPRQTVETRLSCLQAVKDAVADYLTKKKTRLTSIAVKALLRAVPSPDWIRVLVDHHNSARNEFQKCEALQLLLVTLQASKVCPRLEYDSVLMVQFHQ